MGTRLLCRQRGREAVYGQKEGSRGTHGGVRDERWAQKDGEVRRTPRQSRRDLREDQPNLSPSRKAKATAVWFSTRGAYANRCKWMRNCDCRQLASGHRETVSLSPGKGRGDLSSKDTPPSPPQLPPAEPSTAPRIPRTAPGSLNSSRSSASPLRAFRTTTQIKANSFLLFLAHRKARNNANSIHKPPHCLETVSNLVKNKL